MNHDGVLDLLAANGSLSVSLANGDGSFAPQVVYDADLSLSDAVVADVDLDSQMDVVALASYGAGVVVFLGNGDGTLGPPWSLPLSEPLGQLAVTDFDGDQRPDVIIADYTIRSPVLLRGHGDGSFAAPEVIPTDRYLGSVTPADLNQDGVVDLVVCDPEADLVSVFLGTGGGSLAPALDHAVGPRPLLGAVGDVHDDGFADVVIRTDLLDTVNNQDSLTVLRGAGDGTLLAGTPRSFECSVSLWCALGDLTGDRQTDLVVACADGWGTALNLTQDETLIDVTTYALSHVGHDPELGDFDQNGAMDLVLASDWPNILLGDGTGRLVTQPLFHASGSTPGGALVDDLDCDGAPDVLVWSRDHEGTYLTALMGPGTQQAQQTELLLSSYQHGVALGDLDRDDFPDVVTASNANGMTTVQVLFGQGDGTFLATTDPFQTSDAIGNIALSDVDLDGELDLVILDYRAVLVLPGRGSGAFGEPSSYELPDFSSLNHRVEVGDLDGDGWPDLVTGSVTVFMNQGDGRFGAPVSLATDTDTRLMALGDVNEDGTPDVIAGSDATDSIEILLGSGDGTFAAPTLYSAPDTHDCAVIAELTGDSHLDLAVSGWWSRTVGVLAGRGDGTFAAPVYYKAGDRLHSLAAADFNQDSRPDLAAVTIAEHDWTHGDHFTGVELFFGTCGI